VLVGLRLAFSGGKALVGTLNRKSGNALGFLTGGRIGTRGGGGGGDPALDASASALTGSAMALEGAAAALKGSAIGGNVGGKLNMLPTAGQRAISGHRFDGATGKLTAVGTSAVDRMAYQQNKLVWDSYGKSAVRQTVASMAQGVVNAGRSLKSVAGSALGLVSKAFWPLMIADLGIEFLKAPLGDFIAGNTQFKRAGALMREDFFGGLTAMVRSWAVGSDAWVGRAESMTIGNSTFKTITLAKLGITNATFDKLEAPVGTIAHAEGILETSSKLTSDLARKPAEDVAAWYRRVKDKLPQAVITEADKLFSMTGGGKFGGVKAGLSEANAAKLGHLLATQTINEYGDLQRAAREDYISALGGMLTERGYTTGEVAALSTEQLANIGNMAATDTAGKFAGLENFLLDGYLGKLGKKIETKGKVDPKKGKHSHNTKGDIVGSTGDYIADVSKAEKLSEAAIKDYYKRVPQNLQDAVNAFTTQSAALDPGIVAGLKKKFGDDWMTAFRDGTTAITDKPIDKKVVAEMTRVFGPHWREALQETGASCSSGRAARMGPRSRRA
jgi:hypothetical protein